MKNKIQNRNGLPDALIEEKRFFELYSSEKTSTPPDWNNPDTWKYIDDIPEDSNFGFAIGNGTNYLFIDGDHIRDPKSGKLVPWAEEVLNRIFSVAKTYWEFSMSWTGIHAVADLGDFAENFAPENNSYDQIIVQMDPGDYGALPKKERDKVPKIEFFYHTKGRFAYLTGQHDELIQVSKDEDAAAIFSELLSVRKEFHEKYGKKTAYSSDGAGMEIDEETRQRVLEALPYISANCSRIDWIHIGIACYNCGLPFEVWDEWSKYKDQRTGELCDKYDVTGKETAKAWKSFKGTRLKWNAGTIIRMAKENGYQMTPKGAGQLPPSRTLNTTLIDTVASLQPEKSYKWSDIGNAELFSDVFSDRVRWNTTARDWYQYDGRIWTLDSGGMIANKCAQELQKALLIYSTTIDDLDVRDKYIEYVRALGSNGKRKRMLEDAKVHKFISAEDLDVDPMILNVQNGVLDLRKHVFKPYHSPDQMLSRICNVEFNPEAKGERWIRFMEEVMEGDQEKISFLQRAFGYSLTGETKEETGFVLYGKSTRNGKSTAMETIKYLLGGDKGYSLAMLPETLAKKDRKDSSRASGDVARLNHCRFLNMPEPDRGMVFDTALLKTMLGRDSITARHLFEREFEFTPQFKLFVNCNHLPIIKDQTIFDSGRLNVIEFNKHFSEAEQDRDLKDKLRDHDELSGVLNWLLEGLKQYHDQGLNPPECVKRATAEYRSVSDKIGNFFDDCMERMSGNNVAGSAVYIAYDAWCKDNGYGCESKGDFFADLRSRNLLAPSGTVDGKTVRNVIRNYHILTFNKNRGTGNDDDKTPFD